MDKDLTHAERAHVYMNKDLTHAESIHVWTTTELCEAAYCGLRDWGKTLRKRESLLRGSDCQETKTRRVFIQCH